MPGGRTYPAAKLPLGIQRIALNSTATFLNSTCSPGSAFVISVETQSVRVAFSGNSTVPTANTGILLTAAGSPYQFEGIVGSKMKFARATAGAILNAQAFSRPGGGGT